MPSGAPALLRQAVLACLLLTLGACYVHHSGQSFQEPGARRVEAFHVMQQLMDSLTAGAVKGRRALAVSAACYAHTLPPRALWLSMRTLATAAQLARHNIARLHCSVQAAAGSNSSQGDAAALLQLKASFTNGDKVLSDWKDGTSPCSSPLWTGIQCDNSSRVQLV